MENIFLNIFLFIGILLIYSGISGMLTDICRKRSIYKRKYLILILGIIVILLSIFPRFYDNKLSTFVRYISIYFSAMFIIFCVASILVNLKIKRKEYSAIIILGGYLVYGNQLTRALKKRLNLAIKIYKKQKNKPKIIVSGGKIRQETITEAEAMAKYLLENNIPEEDIIKEDKSKNTLENFKFSREKLEELNIHKNIAFVSSNFHILRAKIYASKFKIKAKGEGSKTLWYYFPEAFINEYLAIMVLCKNILIIYSILALIAIIIF